MGMLMKACKCSKRSTDWSNPDTYILCAELHLWKHCQVHENLQWNGVVSLLLLSI